VTLPAPREDPKPWEMQPGEGVEAFQAFALYRDLGPGGSTAKVADALRKSNALIERWSRQHGWVSRRAAWVAELDRRHLENVANDQTRFKRAEAAIGSRLLQLADRRISGERRETPEGPVIIEALNPGDLDARDVAAILKIASDLGRRGLGMMVDGTLVFTRGEVKQLVDEIAEITLPRLAPEDRAGWIRSMRALGERRA
jgi:hypothetical protein